MIKYFINKLLQKRKWHKVYIDEYESWFGDNVTGLARLFLWGPKRRKGNYLVIAWNKVWKIENYFTKVAEYEMIWWHEQCDGINKIVSLITLSRDCVFYFEKLENVLKNIS